MSSAIPECKLFIQQTFLKLYILGSSPDQITPLCVILGFRLEVDENCALLGSYTAGSGNFIPTFLDKLSVPSPGVK
jgi:hypothetical protein